MLVLGVGDGILNDHDYYWRVIPTDPYGATPDEHNEELIIESATIAHAGWYRATQILNDKTEPATAEFYLTVYDAVARLGAACGVYHDGDVGGGDGRSWQSIARARIIAWAVWLTKSIRSRQT